MFSHDKLVKTIQIHNSYIFSITALRFSKSLIIKGFVATSVGKMKIHQSITEQLFVPMSLVTTNKMTVQFLSISELPERPVYYKG